MSANFYSNAGVMTTGDTHQYKPLPPAWLHVVSVPFSWASALSSQRANSVTSTGEIMIKGGFDCYYVIHGPVGPPEGAIAWPAQLAKIIVMSGSKAQLTVHSVTSETSALACCFHGMLGYNVNCNDPMDLLNGLVVQTNTVQTEPTMGDLVGAVLGYATDVAINSFIGGFLEGLNAGDVAEVIVKHLLRRLPDALKPIIGDIADIPGFVGQKAQEWIDEGR